MKKILAVLLVLVVLIGVTGTAVASTTTIYDTIGETLVNVLKDSRPDDTYVFENTFNIHNVIFIDGYRNLICVYSDKTVYVVETNLIFTQDIACFAIFGGIISAMANNNLDLETIISSLTICEIDDRGNSHIYDENEVANFLIEMFEQYKALTN